MARILDADRIEKARHQVDKISDKETERKRLRDTIQQNRNGERKVTVILPSKQSTDEESPKKLRVAAYCRVSTAEEAQVGSFEMQIHHFTEVIESNPQYELARIYKDEGISGTSVAKRKEFQEMLEDAQNGKIDLILTKSISRFGRNIVDILTSLRLLGDLNPPVSVNFEMENIDTSDGKNKLLISMLSALAELESQQKSEAIKSGIRYRMHEGLYKFAVRNTIGYYRDYAGAVKIEPAGAEIVGYIYDSFLEGSSPQDIANALTQQGISTPKGMGKWQQATIKGILSNEKYCGDVLYQKTYTKDFLTHKTAKNDNILVQYHWENCHPAIIKRPKWNMAQELLSMKKWGRQNSKIKSMPKKFVVARVKSGRLSGFYLLDSSWNSEERSKFISLLTSINELENS